VAPEFIFSRQARRDEEAFFARHSSRSYHWQDERTRRSMGHRRERGCTIAALALGIGLLLSSSAGAEELQQMHLTIHGGVVVRFEGVSIVGELDAEITLSGHLPVDGVATPFRASGRALGIAKQVEELKESLGWGVFTTTGELENGAQIEIHGAAIMRAEGISLTDGLTVYGSGSFFLVVLLANRRIGVTGEIHGSGSGRLVPAEEPATIAFSGSGETVLEPHSEVPGVDTSNPDDETSLDRLLWDLELWPEELPHEFLRLYDAAP